MTTGGIYFDAAGGTATNVLNNSGTLNASGIQFQYTGSINAATINLTGGVLNLANQSSLNSNNTATGTGSVTVNIGSGAILTDPGYFYLSQEPGETTIVTQTGGTFNAASGTSNTNTNGMFFNHGTSTYALLGGVLNADAVATQDTSSLGTFIFNGGTVQSQLTSGNGYGGGLNPGFFSPPTTVVGANGGTFNIVSGDATILLENTPIATANTAVPGFGTLDNNGVDGGITKTGGGTLAMTGANTYNGPTAILGGTLILANDANTGFTNNHGSVNNSSGITINGSGAKFVQLSSTVSTPAITLTTGTLDGIGGVGSVTVGSGTGGIVTNGNGSNTGVLTMNALTFTGAATDNILIGSGTLSPGQIVSNTLSTPITAGLVLVNVSATSLTDGQTYDLIQYGSYVGSPMAFVLGTVTGGPANETYSIGESGNDVVLFVGASAAPEPTTVSAIVTGMSLTLMRRRRRAANVAV